MNHTRFVEKCRQDPILLKALFYSRIVGEHYGRDLLVGLEHLRQVYLDHQEEVDMALDLATIWLDEGPLPEEDLGPENNPLGSKGC